ncbi:unnamed protein product [Clonostachys solani]|uniref:Uncharacterized protein n=1 Tax=Clonostachys solani TaxID=160281 RepID=A0A9N9ZEB9_9HYPO|nr:unnamed protein product [Clonostachys solani]
MGKQLSTYMSNIWRVGIIAGPMNVYITDETGRVQNGDGRLGIESKTSDADIRILGQNSVARILEGSSVPLIVLPVWVDTKIRDGSVIDLNTVAEKTDHFRILNLAWENYDDVHKRFPPFSGLPNGENQFPLGKKPTLQETKDQAKRIEIVFPDNLPQDKAFCEPMSISTVYPLIHLKGRLQNFDHHLFGEGVQPTLIPSELSHALHFSRLDLVARGSIETHYVSFLLPDLAAGRDGSHYMGKRTSSMVAYIEAMDHFSSRFSVFLSQSGLGVNLETEFVNKELSDTGEYWLKPMRQAGRVTASEVKAQFSGDDDEGAVYGAIFLDFARRTTLATAVDAYHRSQALSFGQYKSWIHSHMSQHTNDIDAVARTWQL